MENTPTGLEKVQNEVFLNLERIKCLIGAGVFTHAYQWLNANRKTYPGFIYGAGKVAVGIALFTITAAAIHTGFGRIVEDIILQAGVCIILISFFCVLLIMAGATYQAGRQVWVTWDGEANERTEQMPLLISNEWQAPAIAPDIILARSKGESLTAFTARVSAITPTSATWYILIKEREMAVTIFKPGKGLHFERGCEPFLNEVPEKERPPASIDHQTETREYYEKYVTWFSIYWPRYSTRAKYEADTENAHKTAVDIMKATASAALNICLLLLFCLPAFGQESKTRQVDEALGTRIREIPEAGDKITFIFQEGSREKYERRTGDGASEYTALLQRTTGLMQYDDQGGRLVAVTKNGEVVARGPEIERVNTKPENRDDQMRPMWARDEASEPGKTGYLSLPDSATTANTLNGARHQWDDGRGQIWQTAKPVWTWVMGIFFSILPILVCIGGLFRYYAGTAANEAFYGLSWIGMFIRRVHEAASGFTLIICWVIATILLVDEFMLFVYLNISLWVMLATWFPSLWLAKAITNWAVPDPPAMIVNRMGIENPYSGQRRIG